MKNLSRKIYNILDRYEKNPQKRDFVCFSEVDFLFSNSNIDIETIKIYKPIFFEECDRLWQLIYEFIIEIDYV